MAEEFVEIEQENDPLGILSKKPVTTKVQGATPVDNDPLGILKKKSTPVVSSVTPSPLPSQPDFLKQGQRIATGEFFTDISKSVPQPTVQPSVKPTLKEAALKDRQNNNSYLGAIWNNVVASAERLAGGAARLAQKLDSSPIARIQETADKVASGVTGVNYEALREKESADKVRNFIGKARAASSSKEYEKGLAEGFDVTNGIGLDDLKGLGAILPSMLADMALAAPTAGTSFAIQGYDDALSTLDDIPEAKNMSETTRTAFGLGGGVIAGVLEKLGMDNILKSGTATRYVTSKILKEASEEIVKKGAKVTAEQFQKAVADKATQMLTKTALKNTVKAGAKSALVEGGTEATQEGAMDLLKLASNQLEGKEIFDEEELKNTAASRYLNSAVMGGIFGGFGGTVMSRTKNLQRHIESEIKNAKTQQDIDNLVSEINQNVEDGTLSNNDAELLKSMVDENLSKPKDLDIKNEKEAKLSEVNGEIALLNKEDRLYNENLDKLNKRKAEINSYYDNLLKKSKKDEEASLDDGKGIPSELIVDTSSIPTGTTEPSKLPITEEIPEITVEGTRNGYEVIEGNEANSIGDIRQEAAERRNNGEKFYIKETVKDGKKIFTLVDTTVFDEFGRPGFKSASVTVPENARLSSEALMGKMKDALGVTDKTSLEELNKITSKMKEAEVEAAPTEVKVTEEVKSNIEKPSAEQQAKDLREGNVVTFTYKSEGEVPEVFKDRISSTGENKIGLFGKKEKFVRVTVPKSLADYELNKSKVTPTEVKVTEGAIEKDDNGDFVPKKFTLNRAGENQAPNIPIESIKEESFGGEIPTDVKQVKLLEIRGKNANGETVGTAWIQNSDGTSFTAEVKFNDEKLSPLEFKPTEVKVTEEVKPTEVKSVKQLREQEQAELDSKIPNAEQYRVDGKVDRAKLTNEEDIKAFDEVYNKYDKLISPLLEKPVEQKVTVELLSSQEPPKKEGETIVTLSGKTEAERLASIAQRQKDTKVSDKVVSDNEIVQAAESYFKKSGNYKNSAEGRAELNDLRIKARENGLTIDTERDAVTKPNKAGRPTKVRYNNKADGEAVVEPNAKTLRDRDIDTQKVYEELTDSGVFLDVEAESGKRMSAAQVEAAIKDINEGIPSKRANKYLDALEKGIAEDAFPLYDKGRGGFAPKLSEIRAELGVEKEVIGEPMDEAAFNKFLDEESKLTPEEEQDLLDNVENLLYEYETTEAGPEGKVQPAETGAKEGVPSEAKPSEPTKSERQAEYEKIKSNKKKKDFVRNNLPEEFKPLADELTEAQMSEIVKSDFDLKTIKNIQDAVQKQSAAEVLQPKQEGDGGAGGERRRVEQGKQGDEFTREGKAKTAEEAQPKGTEEGEVIGITHEQLNEVARELDFPEYEASPETVEQWDAEAKERLSKDPEYANKLIAKYEEGKIPTPQEQRAMLVIISSAKAKINANPSPENLAQFKRIMELSNNVGGKLVGQSLRARQGVKQVEDTLPDFLLMRENDRGYPFTESEIKNQARIFEELQKEKNALKEALQKSEEANAKLIAEMGVNKAKAAARKAAKKTREEYVIERKQSLAAAREALKKLRTGEEGVTSVAVPYFRELKAVAPHVKDYIKSLVEEGANKLDDIVNDTYAEFKDMVVGMTKKDVLDIFNGEYDESKPRTRNQKAEELRLLQREAALIKELENVRKGIEKEKNPAQKVKKNERILELEDKIKEVKRLNKERDRVPQEFTESEFASKTEDELLASKRKMLTKRIEKLQDDIKNKRYLEEKAVPPKLELDRKTQLLKDKVIKLERQIEAERQKDAYKKMSKTEKAFDHINQITGIRRVMQTAFDLSVSLRQGVLVAFNPRKWDVFSKAFGNQMKSAFSDKKYNSLMYDIHNSSEYNKMLEDGIKFNELDALKNEERNEDFQKSFLYGIKIPVVRQLITEPLLASQRAADGFLNTARYELYLKYEKQLLKQGITRQSDPEAYKKMADLVMNMTGRGKLVSFLESGKANKVVSNTFYGARLMAANINSLNPVKYYKLPPGVRKEVMKDMLSYVTTTAGIMLAASAAGAKVEMDPDEPDFLQIRFGDKVYDITGGKAAYLRTFFRMTSALYSRFTDNKYNQQKKIERAGSSLFKFFRNKLAPNTGYAVNMALGKNTLNQDFDPYEVLEAYPMYVDDFAEALKDEGITSIATVLAPNILGIGYGNYANQANKESLESSLERMLNSDEMNPELIKNHKDGNRPINEKEFDDLVKLRDANIEKEIRKLYDGKSKFNLTLDKGNVVTKKVEDMTEEEVKKAKKSIASEATRLSKEQLFGKEKKTREEKMEDKRLSRARKRFD